MYIENAGAMYPRVAAQKLVARHLVGCGVGIPCEPYGCASCVHDGQVLRDSRHRQAVIVRHRNYHLIVCAMWSVVCVGVVLDGEGNRSVWRVVSVVRNRVDKARAIRP